MARLRTHLNHDRHIRGRLAQQLAAQLQHTTVAERHQEQNQGDQDEIDDCLDEVAPGPHVQSEGPSATRRQTHHRHTTAWSLRASATVVYVGGGSMAAQERDHQEVMETQQEGQCARCPVVSL